MWGSCGSAGVRERKFLIAGVVRDGFLEEVGFELSLGGWGGFVKVKTRGA